jgi:hypothetical protein
MCDQDQDNTVRDVETCETCERGEEIEMHLLTDARLFRHIAEQTDLITNQESRIRRWISSCEEVAPKRSKVPIRS